MKGSYRHGTVRPNGVVRVYPASMRADTAYVALQSDEETGDFAPGRKVQWSNVSATVIGNGRIVLCDVSGSCAPGSMRAIMGASGSGKTTLLNILADRSTKGLSTTGSISGGRGDDVAFVEQEICCVATATVREAILFAAYLRGPASTHKLERVERLLRMLRLEECADTMLGSDLLKGASGGERRRTSVAVELVTDPSVVFLDECTSGLDSYAAYIVVKLLRDEVAGRGKSVLCTIHQPSSEVFNLFESVDFLRKGKLVYSGSTGGPLRERFNLCGKEVPPDTNLADHALFVFQTCTDQEAVRFERVVKRDVIAFDTDEVYNCGVKKTPPSRRNLVSLLEIEHIGKREMRMLLRDPREMTSRVLTTCLLAVLVSICFKNAGNRNNDAFENVQTHFGCLTQICTMGAMAISQPLILSFPAQRAVLLREYASHTYSMVSYVCAKLTIELASCILQSSLLVSISYYIMGLQGTFYLLVATVALVALSTSSSILLVSAFADKPQVAMQFAPLIIIPQLLFMGIFVRISQVPTIVRWAQWLCSLKYGINLLLLLEFRDCHTVACDQLFDSNNVHQEQWRSYILALVAIFVGFRASATLVLRTTALRM